MQLVYSLSIMSSRIIHAVAYVRISSLFKAEQYSTVYIDHILFIHSSFNGHSCFYLLAILNDAAMNMGSGQGPSIPRQDPVGNAMYCLHPLRWLPSKKPPKTDKLENKRITRADKNEKKLKHLCTVNGNVSLTTGSYYLMVLEAQSPKARSSEGHEGGPDPGLSPSLWRVDFTWSFLFAGLCVQISPSLKDTRAHPSDLILMNYICYDPIPSKITS